jgi:hypothetical protein
MCPTLKQFNFFVNGGSSANPYDLSMEFYVGGT